MGFFFAGMLVGYFFYPKFIDDFCLEDLAESSSTNARLIQPSNELGALSEAVAKSKSLSQWICVPSLLVRYRPKRRQGSNAQNKGSNEKAFLQSEGAKNLNLNDLVASTPRVTLPSLWILKWSLSPTLRSLKCRQALLLLKLQTRRTMSKNNREQQ
uniref:Uncharacterized protein n=1 Tax=Ditylenchus dipsaci TaxID=166011 RepID=A0A915DZR5_9BILA